MKHYTLTFMHNYLYKDGGLSCMRQRLLLDMQEVRGAFLHAAEELTPKLSCMRQTLLSKESIIIINTIFMNGFDLSA